MSTVAQPTPVGVLGAGTMGSGIAQVFAMADRPVVVVEATEDLAEQGIERLRTGIRRLVSKDKMSSEAGEKTLALVTPATDYAHLHRCALVVEAVSEDPRMKSEVLARAGKAMAAEAILATNTSSISITALAKASGRPDRFAGMHFMNPVPVMKLVEVIRGQLTSEATFQSIMATARELGKIPVAVNDYPGFVSNRILMPMINEAVYALMEGVADRDAIDTVMKLGMNHPMGPLTLADFIGLDVCLAIMEVLHRELGDDKYRPCPLLRRMVAAGLLGEKSGRGFYDYAG